MATPRETAALKKHLDAYAKALKTASADNIMNFVAPTADFRAKSTFIRGNKKVSAAVIKDQLRASGEIVGIKWLGSGVALVDGHYAARSGQGWFTEIWSKDRAYTIRTARTRLGSAAATFEAMNAKPVQVLGDVAEALRARVEAELRVKFKAFRTAFNKGDKEGMLKLFTKTADAIVAFSFIRGRAQILTGQMAIGAKAERMMDTVSNPNPMRNGATIAGGEPKVIQVLSPSLAVVDGTAQIGGIPKAHEFSPTAMKGVYTDIWVKTGNNWAMEGTRPWF